MSMATDNNAIKKIISVNKVDSNLTGERMEHRRELKKCLGNCIIPSVNESFGGVAMATVSIFVNRFESKIKSKSKSRTLEAMRVNSFEFQPNAVCVLELKVNRPKRGRTIAH